VVLRLTSPQPNRTPAAGHAQYKPTLLPWILDVRKLVELDVVENAVDLFDAPDVNRLHDVARLGIDHDRAAWAREFHAFDRGHEAIRIDRTAGFLQRLGDRCHPVVTGAGHEI